jgi:hypothetical protein
VISAARRVYFFSVLTLTCLMVFCSVSYSQQKPEIALLPKGFYFEPLLLDPTQCQVAGGLHKIWKSGNEKDGLFIPISLGFQQSFVRFEINDHSGLEMGMGAAAFTQFEILKLENSTYRGEMLNADYKVAGFINGFYNHWSFRFQIFHVSSHLSDDYLLRNHITTPDPGTMNYEQADLAASYVYKNLRLYGGFGYVITRYAVRDRLSFETGFEYKKRIFNKDNIGYIAGSDIKFFQQNNYEPDIRIASGFEIGKPENIHMAFLIEYFGGHLPYSTLNYGKIHWFGISTVIIPALRN